MAFLRFAFATILLTASSSAPLLAPSYAAAPQVRTSAPAYYRMMLGDFEITVLSDGTVALPFTKLLQNIARDQIDSLLAQSFLADPVETSVNAYLVNTGASLVLIDTGAGPLFGPTLGRLLNSLKASGYQPEQVDEIYLSHMHGDHLGGLATDGKANFPNAVVRADLAEGEYWLSKAKMEAAPKEAQDVFRGAMMMMQPYLAAGRYKPYEGDTELVPGIRAVVSRGHTPGHSVFVIQSKGDRLVLWGDLIHQAAVQFADPAVTIAFDSDPETAAQQRRRVFAEAASDRHWVAGSHLPFPGIGHLRKESEGYAFVPANYSPLVR
jgi:glyoxylase-like metal-dependent hydrolase (beta-lactamase superfamily II)